MNTKPVLRSKIDIPVNEQLGIDRPVEFAAIEIRFGNARTIDGSTEPVVQFMIETSYRSDDGQSIRLNTTPVAYRFNRFVEKFGSNSLVDFFNSIPQLMKQEIIRTNNHTPTGDELQYVKYYPRYIKTEEDLELIIE